MGSALYRKYRSRTLDDIVGQEHVTTLLAGALKSGRVAHAYLFTGPRGVGKTSIARILAHEILEVPYDDEHSHLDIIEIDAASNNGVEDIRDLRDKVQIAPTSAKKKIYIIDEVHMLSKPAFNALLKTLEEPPEHVVFILATTDIDKVPDTIISRTQRHTFRRATDAGIIKNLRRIATHESAKVDDAAYELVARHADGSFRDSVSMFDQLLSGANGGKVGVDDVTKSLGLVTTDIIGRLMDATHAGDIRSINEILNELEASGVPPRTTALQLIDHVRGELAGDPSLVRLIDALLDISRSQYPELKLLTVLSLHAQPDRQAVQPQPRQTTGPAQAPEMKPEQVPAPTKRPAPTKPEPVAASAEQASTPQPAPAKIAAKPASGPFDWDALVAHVKSHHVAVYSVLSKCEPELDGSVLRLYTKSAFYKKKLDDSKYRLLLTSSLQELGYQFDIETVATAKPLQDSQAARVAAIMGGGEEVSVSDA